MISCRARRDEPFLVNRFAEWKSTQRGKHVSRVWEGFILSCASFLDAESSASITTTRKGKYLRHKGFLGNLHWQTSGALVGMLRCQGPGRIARLTWSEQDDRHGDEGADHQDDQQSDGDPFPVPLRRTHPTQVLRRQSRSGQNSGKNPNV